MAYRIQQIQRHANHEPISPASPDEDILTWDQRPEHDWPNPQIPSQTIQQHGYQNGKPVFRHLTTRERAPASAWDDLSEYIQHARRANTLPPSRPRNGASRERAPQVPSARPQGQRRPPPGLRVFPRPAPPTHCHTCHGDQGYHNGMERDRDVHNSHGTSQKAPTLQVERIAAEVRHHQPQASPPLQQRTSSLPKAAPPAVKVLIPPRSTPVPVEIASNAAETMPRPPPATLKPPVPAKDRPDSVIMAAAAAGALPPMFFEMQRQSYVPGGTFTLDLSQISKLEGLTEEEEGEGEEEGCGDALRRLEQLPPQPQGHPDDTIQSSDDFSNHEMSHNDPHRREDDGLYDEAQFEDHQHPQPSYSRSQYPDRQNDDPQYNDSLYPDTQYDDPDSTDEYSPYVDDVDDDNHRPLPTFTPTLPSIDTLLSLPTQASTTTTFTYLDNPSSTTLATTAHHRSPSTASTSFLSLPTATTAATHNRNLSIASFASSTSQYTATWSEKDLEGDDFHHISASNTTTSSPLTDYDELMRELVRDMDGEVKGGVGGGAARGSGRVPGWAKALLAWRVDEEREREQERARLER